MIEEVAGVVVLGGVDRRGSPLRFVVSRPPRWGIFTHAYPTRGATVTAAVSAAAVPSADRRRLRGRCTRDEQRRSLRRAASSQAA